MLFAEGEPSPVTTVLTVALTLLAREVLPALRETLPAVAKFFKGLRSDARKETADERKARKEDAEADERREATTLLEWQRLCDIQRQRAEEAEEEARQERHRCRDDMATLTNRLNSAEIRLGRAIERILALQDALQEAKIPFRPWDDGSSPHQALAPDKGGTPK